MFGKKSSQSANDKFVMAMGKKSGNLKAPVQKQAMKPSALPSVDKMKSGVTVNRNKPQSLGRTNTFKTSGIIKK